MVNIKTSLRSLDGIDIPDNVTLKIYNSVCPKYDAGRVFGSPYSHITIGEWWRFVYARKRNTIHGLVLSSQYVTRKDARIKGLLTILNEINGFVIISNHEFLQFVRDYYPNITCEYSITHSGINDNFVKLEALYDVINPRMEFFYSDISDGWDYRKYSAMLTDICYGCCPIYDKHFRDIELTNFREVYNPDVQCCTYRNVNVPNLRVHEILSLMDRGVRNFKLSTRAMSEPHKITGFVNNTLKVISDLDKTRCNKD